MTAADKVSDAELIVQLGSALSSPRFPVRRDAELEGAVSDAGGAISFYDHHWPSRSVLAIVAVRIAGDDVATVLRAVGIKQLIRAAVAKTHTALDAIAVLEDRVDTAGFDVGLFVLDTVSGMASSAMIGKAAVAILGATDRLDQMEMTAGDIAWLSVGDADTPSTADVPSEGIATLVRGKIDRTRSGAVCALYLKERGRLAHETIFSLGNTHGEIQVLAGKVRRFMEMHGAGEDDVTAIEVALDEILTNAVNYGFEDGNAHEILVSLSIGSGLLTIEVQDDGLPFDPLSVPAPDLDADLETRKIGGLGMHFVRTLLDTVFYSRCNGWNILKLEKQIAGMEEKA